MKMRNKLISIIAGCILSATAGTSFALTQDEVEQFCYSQQRLAYTVMETRQKGIPINTLLEAIQGNEPIDKTTRIYIHAAYSERMYLSEEHKVEAANFFSNAVFNNCIQHFNQPENKPSGNNLKKYS